MSCHGSLIGSYRFTVKQITFSVPPIEYDTYMGNEQRSHKNDLLCAVRLAAVRVSEGGTRGSSCILRTSMQTNGNDHHIESDVQAEISSLTARLAREREVVWQYLPLSGTKAGTPSHWWHISPHDSKYWTVISHKDRCLRHQEMQNLERADKQLCLTQFYSDSLCPSQRTDSKDHYHSSEPVKPAIWLQGFYWYYEVMVWTSLLK